jgi:hypothetical protein
MVSGHDYTQIEQLARERLQGYERDADLYRNAGYAQRRGAALAFSEWLGTLLLEWGRRVRERPGDVTVRIALSPRRDTGRHAA